MWQPVALKSNVLSRFRCSVNNAQSNWLLCGVDSQPTDYHVLNVLVDFSIFDEHKRKTRTIEFLQLIQSKDNNSSNCNHNFNLFMRPTCCSVPVLPQSIRLLLLLFHWDSAWTRGANLIKPTAKSPYNWIRHVNETFSVYAFFFVAAFECAWLV